MNISENWLRSWINPLVNSDELAYKLTMAGLEVENIVSLSAHFSGVIIGEIVAIKSHPKIAKLKIVQVDSGEQPHQVICGAYNVGIGLKAPFAIVGAVLGDRVIETKNIGGQISCGMLCSATELKLEGQNSEGILELPLTAKNGMNLSDYLQLSDRQLVIGITPNRADCLSVMGIARELSVLFSGDIELPQYRKVSISSTKYHQVKVENPEYCPHFAGRIIEGINNVTTPNWMRSRLVNSGIGLQNIVVDVTNYVMLELGQPMHGYDADCIDGDIVVRFAQDGENITLLNDQKIKLKSPMLLIADQQKPLAMAGIMGGKDSMISVKTKRFFLESAYFDPVKLAGVARSCGLHTDASHRFERGVDFELPVRALEYATALILDICGGNAGPITVYRNADYFPKRKAILLHHEKINTVLGLVIASDKIENILTKLGFELQVLEKSWKVIVPSWRFDITIEEDLIEEVGRIYGYDNLPSTNIPHGNSQFKSTCANSLANWRQVLVQRGYFEAINLSLIDPNWQKIFYPDITPVKLQNSISQELSVMRISILPNLIKTIAYNQKRQRFRVRLFEAGQCFHQHHDEINQVYRMAAVISGNRHEENWSFTENSVDFFDLKGDLSAMFANEALSFIPKSCEMFHPWQCAEIYHNNNKIGYIGAIHPSILKKIDIKGAVFAFEIACDLITTTSIVCQELSKYPEIKRDIAVVVEQSINCAKVIQVIRDVAGKWLTNILVFDVYIGNGIPKGKKSLAMRMTWQHSSRTLEDSEIDEKFDKIIEVLVAKVKATLRQ